MFNYTSVEINSASQKVLLTIRKSSASRCMGDNFWQLTANNQTGCCENNGCHNSQKSINHGHTPLSKNKLFLLKAPKNKLFMAIISTMNHGTMVAIFTRRDFEICCFKQLPVRANSILQSLSFTPESFLQIIFHPSKSANTQTGDMLVILLKRGWSKVTMSLNGWSARANEQVLSVSVFTSSKDLLVNIVEQKVELS